jgi:hypothetical protein
MGSAYPGSLLPRRCNGPQSSLVQRHNPDTSLCLGTADMDLSFHQVHIFELKTLQFTTPGSRIRSQERSVVGNLPTWITPGCCEQLLLLLVSKCLSRTTGVLCERFVVVGNPCPELVGFQNLPKHLDLQIDGPGAALETAH